MGGDVAGVSIVYESLGLCPGLWLYLGLVMYKGLGMRYRGERHQRRRRGRVENVYACHERCVVIRGNV